MKKIAAVLLSLLLVACASEPKTDTAQAPQPNRAASPLATQKPAPVTSGTAAVNADIASNNSLAAERLATEKLAAEKIAAERLAAEKLAAIKSAAEKTAAEIRALQKLSIYFDYNKFSINPEYTEIIQRQASFISAHKNDMVTVEGNADERGSNEYNLALGDKRAHAVRKNLELLGVPATQIKAVSYGEEKPRLTCHEEKCWKENRRDDFIHRLN